MNKVTKVKAMVWLVCGLLMGVTANTQASNGEAEHSIQRVVEQFKQAILNKDQEGFLKLFHSGTVSWVGVISAETIDLLVSKDPRYAQQPRIMPGTPREFIQGIIASEVTTREEADNLQIDADGEVASVTFDYRLFKNDSLNNWGKENWQMISTPDGWKINAVNFSYTLNPSLLATKP